MGLQSHTCRNGAESVFFRSIVPQALDSDEIDGAVLGIGWWSVCPIPVKTKMSIRYAGRL